MPFQCAFPWRRPAPLGSFSRLFSPHGLAGRTVTPCIIALALALFALAGSPRNASAEEMVKVKGRVVADGSKAPIIGAHVTIFDEKNKVVAEGDTDVQGKYALPLPLKYLHLPVGKRGPSIGGIVGGVVGGVIGF